MFWLWFWWCLYDVRSVSILFALCSSVYIWWFLFLNYQMVILESWIINIGFPGDSMDFSWPNFITTRCKPPLEQPIKIKKGLKDLRRVSFNIQTVLTSTQTPKRRRGNRFLTIYLYHATSLKYPRVLFCVLFMAKEKMFRDSPIELVHGQDQIDFRGR